MLRFCIYSFLIFHACFDLFCVDYHWDIRSVDTTFSYNKIAGINNSYISTFTINNVSCKFGITDFSLDNWKQIVVDNPQGLNLFDACMTEDNRLFVAAGLGNILESTIDSEVWEYKKIIEESVVISTIAFRDNQYGIVANNGRVLYSTTDGGTSWNMMTEQVNDFTGDFLIKKASFIGDTLVLFINDFSTKSHYSKMSFDSGESWQPACQIDVDGSSAANFYYNNGKWWLIGTKRVGTTHRQYDIIHYSDNNGKTWTKQLHGDFGSLHGLHSIQFYDNSLEGLAVGGMEVFYTNDGGVNWEMLLDPLTQIDTITNGKGTLLKINNEMLIVGYNRIIKFVRSGSSVMDYSINDKEVEAYLSRDNQLEIKLNDNQPINQIYLYNLEGKIIYYNTELSDNIFSLNIENVTHNGLVIIEVHSGEKVFFKKIIIFR